MFDDETMIVRELVLAPAVDLRDSMSVASAAKAVRRLSGVWAIVAAFLSMVIAVGLKSTAVTWQLRFAFKTGRTLDPQPQPSSRNFWVGSSVSREGNSSNKYLKSDWVLTRIPD